MGPGSRSNFTSISHEIHSGGMIREENGENPSLGGRIRICCDLLREQRRIISVQALAVLHCLTEP